MRAQWRKDNELDEPTRNSIYCKDGANLIRGETKTTREFEGELSVVLIGNLPRIIQIDGEELVVGDRYHDKGLASTTTESSR